MEYKPIKGNVNIGSGYWPLYNGFGYCAEITRGGSFPPVGSILEFAQNLRHYRINSSQIYNIGTNEPFITNPINEEKLEELMKILERPTIFVMKLERHNNSPPIKRSKDYGVDLNNFYTVEIEGYIKKYKLSSIPKVLNSFGCRKEDLILREQISKRSFHCLDIKDRMYILSRLKN